MSSGQLTEQKSKPLATDGVAGGCFFYSGRLDDFGSNEKAKKLELVNG
jgi:hypothetical protein